MVRTQVDWTQRPFPRVPGPRSFDGWAAPFQRELVLSHLHKLVISAPGVSLVEALRITTEAGLPTDLATLGRDRYDDLLDEIIALLGNDADRWEVFMGLSPDWTAGLTDLVFMAADVDLMASEHPAESDELASGPVEESSPIPAATS